jgi:acetolactate synthase-1/2/3 large subunit
MHEQAGGFAAEGYAKIKGDIGVALATSGPGGQNFVTPIANCFYDSVP